jgi:Phytanoyl-CoA dioxygenase (PhyH)
VQRRLVHDLCALGIAFARFDDLGIDPEEWERLSRTAHSFAHSEKVTHAIRDNPAASASPPAADAYLVKLLPSKATFASSSPLLHVGLAPAVLDTVNSYLGLWSKLIYADMWHSIPLHEPPDAARRIGSQRWHRDPEDRRMVKIYLYFSDVHAGAGALEYVPGSATTGPGRYHTLWPWKPRGARYPTDDDFDRRIPTADRVSCLGPPGTIIFCDTDGFHRGGIATTGVRLVATWTFVTPASIAMVSARRFIVEDLDRERQSLSDAARFAIT